MIASITVKMTDYSITRPLHDLGTAKGKVRLAPLLFVTALKSSLLTKDPVQVLCRKEPYVVSTRNETRPYP